MSTPIPREPKIYHIVHIDRLASIRGGGALWSDVEADDRGAPGTVIGMNTIKQRRRENVLNSQRNLRVGDCVPFYFCPRSVMLYVIYRRNHPDLEYTGGQEPIVHLEADLRQAVSWAEANGRRWAFTSSNAGSGYFDDYADLARLDRIDWAAVQARQWAGRMQEGKQAEFLMERSFPWALVSRVGVHSPAVREQVLEVVEGNGHGPAVEVKRNWYY